MSPDSQPEPPSGNASEPILEKVLQPLLDDFQYWFQRSLDLLERETMPFLEGEAQPQLIQELHQALGETRTASALLKATDGQAGVDPAKVMDWHRLVSRCWSVARLYRMEKAATDPSP